MSAIIPAILAKSRDDLEQKLALLVGLADTVQIDVVDGRFVSPASWPYTEKEAFPYNGENLLPHLGELHFEMDLMVSDPEEIVGAWIAAGAERLVMHAESSRFLQDTFAMLSTRYGHAKDFAPGLLSLGIAINIQSELALIEAYIDKVDYVQFMGIQRIGKQGERFDPHLLRKVAAFRKKYPDIPIQVDGGVSHESARALLSVGVDRLVVGSALWTAPNLREAYTSLLELTQEYGIYS